jgi:hypothetical protein
LTAFGGFGRKVQANVQQGSDVNFVGRPPHLETYDLAAQQAHLATLAVAVNGAIEAHDWTLGAVPGDKMEIKVELGGPKRTGSRSEAPTATTAAPTRPIAGCSSS